MYLPVCFEVYIGPIAKKSGNLVVTAFSKEPGATARPFTANHLLALTSGAGAAAGAATAGAAAARAILSSLR